MMASLEKTGSDFVVGSVQRRFGSNTWMPLWAQEVHAQDRLGITLADLPTVLQDVFAWNKVFRRGFFLKHVREFPEGIRYEDQAPTARAYTAAKAFDVLHAVVYTWMIRDDGTSITQGKTNIKDLEDRLAVKRSVAQILGERAPRHVYEYWLAKAIGFDLESYFVQIPRTDEDYWATLRDGVRRLADRLEQPSWDLVKFNDRMKIACALYGTSADVAGLVTTLEETGDGYQLVETDGRIKATADYLQELSFEPPEELVSARPIDFEPRARVLTCAWPTPGVLELTCQVMIVGHSGGLDDGGLTVGAENAGGEVIASATAERTTISNPNEVAADVYADHTHDVFRVRLDLSDMAQLPHSGVDDRCRLVARRSTKIGEFSTYFTRRSLLSSAAAFPHGELVAGERLALRWDVGLGLSVNRPQPHAIVSRVVTNGRRVTVDVNVSHSPHAGKKLREISLFHKWSGMRITASPQVNDGGAARYILDVPELSARYRKGAQRWRARVTYEDGASELLQFGGGDAALYQGARQGNRLAPVLTANGFLQFDDSQLGGCVSDVAVEDQGGTLQVSGELDFDPYAGSVELALVSQRGAVLQSLGVNREGTRFSARIPLALSNGAMAQTGGYSLRARTVSNVGGVREENPWRWLPVAPGLTQRLPHYEQFALSDLRFSRTEKARSLWVNVYPHLGEVERGRFGGRKFQRQLEQNPPELQDAILFESYGGKTCTDSPAAIAAELRRRGDVRPQYFGISDGSVIAPEGTTPVVIGSAEYRTLLSTCRWLVNNNNFPYYFRKRAGQTYIQTWHGTPLKRIGNDVPGANLSLSYRGLMQREAGYWDVLLSQNEYSAGIFPAAFGYHGVVETLGYPRNDSLFAGDAGQHRAEMRAELGVAPGVTAVLYAPTWRDNVKTNGGAYKLVTYLDVDELERVLGKNFVVLQRGHSNTASTVRVQDDPRIIDVTSHPDLNGLFLASDALVTDYSSVFFDYSDTGKPILFLVPDLEDYAGTTRGFYVGLDEIAPGPLCSDSAEVAAWLADISKLRREWADKYKAFGERFTPHDSGDTAAAVVDHLL
jgi:CDP-glycerol glycerophosphotransferase